MFSRKSFTSIVAVTALIAVGADAPQTEPWDVLKQAIRAGGPDQASALGMLGAIGDRESRALMEAVLTGKDGAAIGFVAAGLRADQCAFYLTHLGRAALNPAYSAGKLSVMDAIARAGSGAAAQILAEIADSSRMPDAGVAFGLLESMGRVAQPLLIKLVTTGRSARSRETAAWALIRMRAADALETFRAALHDPDEEVRTAGAQGLAYLEDPDGKPQLEATVSRAGSGTNEQIQALVGLAILGDPKAFDSLGAIIGGSDEAARGRAVWAVAWSGNRHLRALVYRLELDRQPVFRRMLAERLLDPADPRDFAVLREMLTNGDEIAQITAAQRLLGTKIGDEAEHVIARAIGSANEAARALAVKTASEYPTLRPELARRLSSPDPTVQTAALSVISDLLQKQRFAEVVPYLSSESRAVSAAAARTLVVLNPNGAKAVLEQGLASSVSHVRIHSAAMLLAAISSDAH